MMRIVTCLGIMAMTLLVALPSLAAEPSRTTREKMDGIVIPKLSFEETSLKAVYAHLRQVAKDRDLQGEGINIMFRCKPESLQQVVTMDFDNIPLEEAIRYICLGTGMNYQIERHALVIADGQMEVDRMEMRTYPVDAGFLKTGHSKKAPSFDDK